MDATEWTATLAAPLPPPRSPPDLPPLSPRLPSLSGPLYPLSIPVCTTRDGWLGWLRASPPLAFIYNQIPCIPAAGAVAV